MTKAQELMDTIVGIPEVSASQAADDAETAELAKLAKAQIDMIDKMRVQSSYLLDAAREYEKWLSKNKVEAHMSKLSGDYAKHMHDNLDKVKDIV